MLNISEYRKIEEKSYITITRYMCKYIRNALDAVGETDYRIVNYSEQLDDDLKNMFCEGADRRNALFISNFVAEDATRLIKAAVADVDAIMEVKKKMDELERDYEKNYAND